MCSIASRPGCLFQEFVGTFLPEPVKQWFEARGRRVGESLADGLLPVRPQCGGAHSPCREHACQRVDQDTPHAELIGYAARMLAAGAAEAAQRELCRVQPALHRYLVHGVRHVVRGDLQKTFSGFPSGVLLAAAATNLFRQCAEGLCNSAAVQRLVRLGSEGAREMRRLNAAQQKIGVRNG